MKLGFSYKFLFYFLLIVVLAYIALKYFNVIEGNKGGGTIHIRDNDATLGKTFYRSHEHEIIPGRQRREHRRGRYEEHQNKKEIRQDNIKKLQNLTPHRR